MATQLLEGAIQVSKYPQEREEVVEGCIIKCSDFRDFLQSLDKNSVDLVLTDPPYTISRKTGFSSVKKGVKRFAVSMDFGEWDHKQIDLEAFAEETYRVLRRGGTAIVWYDAWKISHLYDAMTDAGFKMLRLIVWNKTNPVPLNSRRTYLSGSREMAVVGVKGGNPTFHSQYDSGDYDVSGDYEDIIEDYRHPIPRHSGKRIHPTQKPLDLFCELVRKHSNPGDLVVDPFLGSGTTAVAALQGNRKFSGCDIDEGYVQAAEQRVKTVPHVKSKTRETKAERFLKLALPDEYTGISRIVEITELKRNGLGFGNGGSWCRDESRLAQTYIVERIKEKGRIVGVKLNGLKSQPITKPIPKKSEG